MPCHSLAVFYRATLASTGCTHDRCSHAEKAGQHTSDDVRPSKGVARRLADLASTHGGGLIPSLKTPVRTAPSTRVSASGAIPAPSGLRTGLQPAYLRTPFPRGTASIPALGPIISLEPEPIPYPIRIDCGTKQRASLFNPEVDACHASANCVRRTARQRPVFRLQRTSRTEPLGRRAVASRFHDRAPSGKRLGIGSSRPKMWEGYRTVMRRYGKSCDSARKDGRALRLLRSLGD